MTWSASFNFRATSGYVTDATGETYAIASDTYPTTRSMNGGGSSVTFGLESGVANQRDRTTASPNNPELSGIWFVQVATSAAVFRVDLPAAGSYVIRVAAGDATSVNEAYYTVFDNATAVITQAQAQTSAPNFFYDATGVQRPASAWQSSNAPQTVTFASTICRLQINAPTGNSSVIAHFSIAAAGGSAAPYSRGRVVNQGGFGAGYVRSNVVNAGGD